MHTRVRIQLRTSDARRDATSQSFQLSSKSQSSRQLELIVDGNETLIRDSATTHFKIKYSYDLILCWCRRRLRNLSFLKNINRRNFHLIAFHFVIIVVTAGHRFQWLRMRRTSVIISRRQREKDEFCSLKLNQKRFVGDVHLIIAASALLTSLLNNLKVKLAKYSMDCVVCVNKIVDNVGEYDFLRISVHSRDRWRCISSCKGMKQFNMGLIIIIGALVGLVAVLTIAGNTLVIVAFGVDPKLRSFGNYFIINLAISDLIVGFLACVYAPALLSGCWQLTRVGCLAWLLLDYVVPLASAWNMALISLDRFWSVARPIQYRLSMSSRRAVVFMSIPWLAGIIWYGPSVLFWIEMTDGTSVVPNGACFVEFHNHAGYLIASSLVEFVLPFLTVATINILIYLNIRRRARGLTTSTKPKTVSESIIEADDQQRRVKAKRLLHRDKKSARSLAILIIIFLFTWAPFQICSLVNAVCNFCIDATINEIVFWLLWLNSTINPILYPLLQQRFRVAFTRLLCWVCGGSDQPTGGGASQRRNRTVQSGGTLLEREGKRSQVAAENVQLHPIKQDANGVEDANCVEDAAAEKQIENN